jgi:hypothetical protein
MKVLVVVDVVVVAVMAVVEIAEVCSTRCLYISLAQVELLITKRSTDPWTLRHVESA